MAGHAMMLDPASDLAGELSSGERLLWSGQPRQGIFLRASDAYMIPFSLFWGGFAIFWETMVLRGFSSEKPHATPDLVRFIFPLFGLPFVLIGIYIIFGRFFADKKQRKKTVYGVTNQRVIIRGGLFSISTKSINLHTLSDLSLNEKSDGYGTISFGPMISLPWRGGGPAVWPNSERYAPPCFDTIPEARRIYEIIRRAQGDTQNQAR